MPKVTDDSYPVITTVATTDYVIIVDDPSGTPTVKRAAVSNLISSSNLPSHTHAASDITSGTLAHERGGLEFDASAVTTGDIIRGSASGTMSLLNVGSDGQVLTAQADGSVAWEDAVGAATDALEFKASVKAATTANITLSGEQTIDGVSCSAGDRVLVKNQSTASENGIYVVVASGSWTRASDYDTGDSAAATFGHIQQGTTNAELKWLCTNDSGSDTIGTHSLTFTLPGSGSVAGPGSSTDNAIARWDGTGGDTLQDSSPRINDNGQIEGVQDAGGGLGDFSYVFIGDDDTGMGWIQANVGQLGSGGTYRLVYYEGGITVNGCVKQLNAVTVGGTTVDWNDGNIQQITLTSSPTLTFTAPQHFDSNAKPARLSLKVTQDATGSRTITWPASVKWAGGTAPTLTTTANAVDIIDFVFDGTSYHGSAFSLDSQ